MSFGPAKYKHVLCSGGCRGRMRGVEEDDEKVKQDFKILNFLWFSVLFGNTIFSFHSHPLFIVPSFQAFLKGLGNLQRN